MNYNRKMDFFRTINGFFLYPTVNGFTLNRRNMIIGSFYNSIEYMFWNILINFCNNTKVFA
jgi:hypothetical protein